MLSTCLSAEYIKKHNFVFFWLLKTILAATKAPKSVEERLNFGSATLFAEYESETRGTLVIRAGGSVATDRPIHHNRPDIIIVTSRPKMVYVIEAAVAHIQNLRTQEKIKRARYEVNSEVS